MRFFKPVNLAALAFLAFPWINSADAARADQPSVASALEPADTATRAEIVRVIGDSERAFNRRDFEAFMDCYAKSPDVEYVFQGRALRGIDAIRKEYASAFFSNGPAKSTDPLSTQAQLSLSELNVIGNDTVVATIRILLHVNNASTRDVNGISTLILRRLNDHWRIVYDHSSMLEAGAGSTP